MFKNAKSCFLFQDCLVGLKACASDIFGSLYPDKK